MRFRGRVDAGRVVAAGHRHSADEDRHKDERQMSHRLHVLSELMCGGQSPTGEECFAAADLGQSFELVLYPIEVSVDYDELVLEVVVDSASFDECSVVAP